MTASDVQIAASVVRHGVLASEDDLLGRYSPVYVLFPPGSIGQDRPFKSGACDYHPVRVEEFLGRAQAVFTHPAEWTAMAAMFGVMPFGRLALGLMVLPDVISRRLPHFRGLEPSPVLVALLFAIPVAALFAVLLASEGDLVIAVVVSVVVGLGFLLQHILVHLPIWPRTPDEIRAYGIRSGGGPDALLTFPHAVWQNEIWKRYGAGRVDGDYAVYGRRVEAERGTVLQYWAYYLYNDWTNRHESDWETVMLFIPEGASAPTRAVYSAHEGAYWREWHRVHRLNDEGQLDPDGRHPITYVGLGSHAQYFEPRERGYRTWLARRHSSGLLVNVESSPDDWRHTDRVVPTPPSGLGTVFREYELVRIPEGITPETRIEDVPNRWWWLGWSGRWGREEGPHGPVFQGLKWTDPWDWARAQAVHDPEPFDPSEA